MKREQAAAVQAANKAASEGEAADEQTAKQVMPMIEEELLQAGQVIQQLWRLIRNSQVDVRHDESIQHLLRISLGLLPRLHASATIGAFTLNDLIPIAEQCLYDMQEAIGLYNDEALAWQIGGGTTGDAYVDDDDEDGQDYINFYSQ